MQFTFILYMCKQHSCFRKSFDFLLLTQGKPNLWVQAKTCRQKLCVLGFMMRYVWVNKFKTTQPYNNWRFPKIMVSPNHPLFGVPLFLETPNYKISRLSCNILMQDIFDLDMQILATRAVILESFERCNLESTLICFATWLFPVVLEQNARRFAEPKSVMTLFTGHGMPRLSQVSFKNDW